MSVPETAVHQNDLPVTRQNDVGITGESLVMESKSVAHVMQELPDRYFWLCVSSPDAGHDFAAFFLAVDVWHAAASLDNRRA